MSRSTHGILWASCLAFILPACTCESTKPIAEPGIAMPASVATASGESAVAPTSQPAESTSSPVHGMDANSGVPAGLTEDAVAQLAAVLAQGGHESTHQEIRQQAIALLQRDVWVRAALAKNRVSLPKSTDVEQLRATAALLVSYHGLPVGPAPESWFQPEALTRETSLRAYAASGLEQKDPEAIGRRIEELLEEVRLEKNL